MEALQQLYLLLICQGFYLGSVCQDWTFPSSITALLGSCVEIPCTYHGVTSGTVWYLYRYSDYPEILNTEDSSSVMEKYRGRTSLVPGVKSCTLRIDPVRWEDGGYYYPGIDRSINAYWAQTMGLYVTEKVNVLLHGDNIMTEGEATTIRCSVEHTCRSSPPDLQWNKPGHVIKKSVKLEYGSWREESELTYLPSYTDNMSPIHCTVTYNHGKKWRASGTLNINYGPKNVTVIVIGMDEVMEGSDVTLQCNSVSRPDVSEYEWYKGETRLPDRGREMTVRNVTRDMEPYSCAARNTVGRGESTPIQIPVPYAPTGVYISYIKNDHEMVCDFRSSRPDVTHYTWMKDGSILHNETGKTLTIDNNGRYSCIAHNTAGNSSSQEIHVQRDTVDLPLILGILAGVCFFLFCIMLICIYLCCNKKSTVPNSPIHGTLSPRSPYNSTVATKENPYGNIQSDNHMQPPSMRSGSSVDVNIEGNYVIYSNSELMEPTNEVEYCVIARRQQNQMGLLSSRTNNADDVEYAILKR